MSATAELIRSEIEQANPVLAGLQPVPNLPEPSEVPDLFRLIGARPEQRENGWVNKSGSLGSGGCCVLSAILLNRTLPGDLRVGLTDAFGKIMAHPRAERLGIAIDFSDGAQDGFDGTPVYPSEQYSIDYRDGHAWGKACWAECVRAGLTEDVAEIDAEAA